jgi:hypothetical protein
MTNGCDPQFLEYVCDYSLHASHCWWRISIITAKQGRSRSLASKRMQYAMRMAMSSKKLLFYFLKQLLFMQLVMYTL